MTTHAAPTTMRHVEISAPGGPEVLRATEGPTPVPARGEVSIRVAAAGVNRPDCLQRKGGYAPPPGASAIPGLEVSGEIAALGEGVERWRVGDRVCALMTGGGYAEYALAPAEQCLPIPEGVALEDAAGLPETCFTVYSNVFDRGGLQKGETFLVHGGSSGIGTIAIQLARAFGAEAYCTVGNVEKKNYCERLGARRAILYKEEDFVAVMKEATGKRGVDVLLDMVGGSYVAKNLAVMATEGRIVQIAWLGGAKVEADFGRLMMKRLVWTGSTLRAREVPFKAAIARALEEKVWPLFARGQIANPVHARFSLDRAAEAHALMESSVHMGKILLIP